MFASTSNRASAAIFLALLYAALLAGCAVPLAPGYQVEKEALTVRFVRGAPPHLAIRADYQLKNVGTTPLNFVEVTVPGGNAFGRANLRILVASHEVTPQAEQSTDSDESTSAASLWRIPLAPALRRKQKINVSLEYDLAATAPTDPRIFAAENMFYLNDSGWFPEFQEPKALFAEDITRPNPADLTVVVPANFLITASGQAHGEKRASAETQHHFRIVKDDFDPYILAGQYNEQRVSTANGTVAVWTFKPIPAAQAQQTAAPIAAAASSYSQNFGPLPKSMKAVYDVELPQSTRDLISTEAALLTGIVYEPANPSGRPRKTSLGSFAVANTWFGHIIRPSTEAWALDQGLNFYASTLSTAGKNPTQNTNVASILSDYDAEHSQAVEKPLLSLTPNDSEAQLQLGGDKMQLFFFALEDKCGRENLIHAMHHMVYALRGQQYGYNDFRAALEQECHQNLAGFFRTWLNQTGIPADFRVRYENASAPQKQNQ